MADVQVRIPCAVESLNAAVAGSTILYEVMRQREGGCAMSLFDTSLPEPGVKRGAKTTPLAERMRPQSLDDFFGQQHLLGAGMPLPAADRAR